MIDSTSLASESAVLVVSCGKISQCISTLLSKVEEVDTTLLVLKVEIESLAAVLGPISVNFSSALTASTASTALHPVTGFEEEFWGNVKRSMNDCGVTLGILERLLQTIKQGGERRFLRRTKISDELERKSTEIALLKNHITTFHKTMGLCVHLISISLQLRHENFTKSLAILLEALTTDITDLHQLIHESRHSTVINANSHALTNLALCVNSAKDFVSAASRIINTRGSLPSDRISTIGDFTNQRKTEITSWIPKPSISEETDQIWLDKSTESILTGTTFDREHVNIQTLLKFAMLAYRAQQYQQALGLLQKFKTRSETRYGSEFENRDELFGLLVTTHCRLHEWDCAEEIVATEFEGREEAVKTLVWCYCEEGKWDEGERILCSTINSENPSDVEINEMFAEIYRWKGNYDKAIKSCDNILQTVEDDHIQFYLSLSLLTQIYEAKGDKIEARLHKDLLPSGIEVCHDLNKLSRMWPDQAAMEVESTLSPYFSQIEDHLPWDEIKENITHGSLGGSGNGYTLLHAFVLLGNELGIKFLLYKGADIESGTKLEGHTPLHLALQKHNSAIVTLLLENDADPLVPDSKEMTPFGLAISLGDEEIIKAMIAHGVNVNGFARGGTTPTKPLMLAIEYGKENAVEVLIEYGALIEAMDENGNTALIKAAAANERSTGITIVKQLLKSGANVNAKNHHNVTTLHVATQSGSEKLVKLLLEKQPDLEARTTNGETALLIAAKEGFTSIVQVLLDNGVECVVGYPRGGTPQDVASRFPIIELLQRARTRKKTWLQRLNSDKMDEEYRSARLATIYKIHQEREMKARREFSYVHEDESEEEGFGRDDRRTPSRQGSSRRVRQARSTTPFLR